MLPFGGKPLAFFLFHCLTHFPCDPFIPVRSRGIRISVLDICLHCCQFSSSPSLSSQFPFVLLQLFQHHRCHSRPQIVFAKAAMLHTHLLCPIGFKGFGVWHSTECRPVHKACKITPCWHLHARSILDCLGLLAASWFVKHCQSPASVCQERH